MEAGVAPLLPLTPPPAPRRALWGTHFPVLPSPPSMYPARRPGQEGQGGRKPWQDRHCPPRPGSTGEEQAGAKSGTGRATAPGDSPPHRLKTILHLGSPLLTWSQSPLSHIGPARGWGAGEEGSWGNTYLLGHQAGDAHGPSHPAFLGPGLQGPCPARLPRRGCHGGLGSPQPACPGAPRPHASTSPAPQRLAAWLPGQPLAWRPGSPGLGLGAGVTLAGSVAGSPPGWGSPWFPPPTPVRPHGPELRSARCARCQPSSRRPALSLSEPPAPPASPSFSRVPTPTPTPPRPARGPLPRGPRLGLLLQPLRSPRPSPGPRQPGLSLQINGPFNTPAPPARVRQTPRDGETACPVTREPRNTPARWHTQTRACVHTHTQSPQHNKQHTPWARGRRVAGRAPRGPGERAGRGRSGGRLPDKGPSVWGEGSGVKAKGLETWQRPREPEAAAGAGPGGGLRRPRWMDSSLTQVTAAKGARDGNRVAGCCWLLSPDPPLPPRPGWEGTGMDWAVAGGRGSRAAR